MKARTKMRLLQGIFFIFGFAFILDRTLRSASQFPAQLVLLNVTEVIVGFILFFVALNIKLPD